MAQLSRNEGHLVVAAIRILQHREGQSPAPEAVAELLDWPAATVRMHLATLQDLGAVQLVESAFAIHVELRDSTRVEELPAEETSGELSHDLADFDRRKQEEAERMARLFAEKDHEKRRGARHGAMEKGLEEFRKRKPRNPFEDD